MGQMRKRLNQAARDPSRPILLHQKIAAGLLVLFAGLTMTGTASADGVPIPIPKPFTDPKPSPSPLQEPAFFKITTGSTASSYFAAGEALAALISHPPGAERCRGGDRCGPVGMLAVAQTSEGALRNIIAVNSGDMQSGLAPADLLNDAVNGLGAFQDSGPQQHIRAIANLYVETLHLVVAKKSNITELMDLANKRVSLGPVGSGSNTYANLLLDSRELSNSVTRSELDLYDAADKLMSGDLDAFFYLGGAPVPFVQDLLLTGTADLVAIRGAPMAVLYESRDYILPRLITNGTYQGLQQRETIGTNAVWIVNSSVSEQRVYEITRALWQQDNRASLRSTDEAIGWYEIEDADKDLPVALHPGALQYYNEVQKPSGAGAEPVTQETAATPEQAAEAPAEDASSAN